MTADLYRSIVVTGAEALPNQSFRRAYQFWLDSKAAQELPLVSSVSAARIPKDLLPNIAIAGVEEGSKRFHIRLVGTRTVQDVGFDATNTMGEDLAGGEEIIRIHEQCVATRSPILAQGRASWSPHDFKTYITLLLPFADGSGVIKRILSYVETT